MGLRVSRLRPWPIGGIEAPSRSRYTVKKGDTLYSIAWRAGLNWKTIASLNGIGPPYRIQQGQVLRPRYPFETPHSRIPSSKCAQACRLKFKGPHR